MNVVILLLCCIVHVNASPRDPPTCLMGYMTDIQTWVDEHGKLTVTDDEVSRSIDLSTNSNVVALLEQNLQSISRSNENIRYLSLARCSLERIPPVFDKKDVNGRPLRQTMEYLTLYGNNFKDISSPGVQYDIMLNATNIEETNLGFTKFGERSIWSSGFQYTLFTTLRELDLRACSIEVIDGFIFEGMPNLEALYIGDNHIKSINDNAFVGLDNLLHLDISRNHAMDSNNAYVPMIMESTNLFANTKKLRSLDLSFTDLGRNVRVLSGLGEKLQRLSLCGSKAANIPDKFLRKTSVKYLDISGNYGILERDTALSGLEDTLEVLYANDVGLENFDIFYKFRKLEVLKLVNNEILVIKRPVAASLINLKVLDLDRNRFGSWFLPIFYDMPKLDFLSLRDNSLNLISREMIDDIANISYVALSGNFMICNCNSREFIDLAARNDNEQIQRIIKLSSNGILNDGNKALSYNIAEREFNTIIERRVNISKMCDKNKCMKNYVDYHHKFLIVDYNQSYLCLEQKSNDITPYNEIKTCAEWQYGNGNLKNLQTSTNLLLLLIIPSALLPLLLIIFFCRRRFSYFFVTMRNSATLSLISKTDVNEDGKIYNYDVFVSYCNDDRTWMLDQLLSHLETECSVSVCLHERDFQVGLSILENIVSCMDRSRTIMLVISQKFLRSQWCQFEMHLAQHRLLETRREDLILILLEEIPRSLRPTTLHYLMLTKTYIVWPKAPAEQVVFWKRLKKSLVMQQHKHKNNTSLV